MKPLNRALTLLTEPSRQDERLTLSELSKSVGLDKNTVHRIAVASGGAVEGNDRSTAHLHATALSKAYPANQPHEEVVSYTMKEPFAAETPFTITDARTLLRVLGTIRRCGYATENRESHLQARRVGVAVLNPQGYAVSAVAVDVPTTADRGLLGGIPRAVMDCAADIEDGLFATRYPGALPHVATGGRVSCLPT